MNCEQDYDEVAHIGATDLYMKVYRGNTIHSWLGYINLAYHSYIREYRKCYREEIIDVSDNIDLKQAIENMSSSYAQYNSDEEYEIVLNRIYLESITSSVDEVLNISRYMEYTSEYYNAKMSIIISLIKGRFVSYMESEYNIAYTHILYIKAIERISKMIGAGKSKDREEDILKAYGLENFGGDD